ncbi:MAG: hypothetical protein DA330_09665 [Nitrososphaera sp.]|jgi:hypothetical protein|nr:hypothetical protein [Nitrososphaera sp.]
MDGNTKRFMMNQLMWLGIYFAISIIISILVPFPYSLIILIGIILGLAYWRRRRMMRQMGSSAGMFGNPFASKGIDYYCMNCGTKHNKAECPNCGSKLKKAGF